MSTELDQFISDTLYVAGLRNIDPVNPVTMSKYSPQKTKFLVTVGYLEPSFSQLPYNLLWLPYASDDSMRGKVLRRTSHSSSEGRKYTWEVIQDIDDLWSEEQYYENIAEVDTRSAGVSWSDVTEATDIKPGLVTLKDPQVEQKVIHTLDDRLSDARTPAEHDHEDYPRTMVHLNGTYSEDPVYTDLVGDSEDFVKLVSAKPPIQGEVFFLIGYDVTRPNMWYGEWRKPDSSDIEWLVPKLVSLDITLPSGLTSVPDNAATDLGTIARYNNGDETVEPLGVRWSVSENDLGVTINASTGLLNVPDIDAQGIVTVTAELTDPNDDTVVVSDTLDVTLDDDYQAPTVIGFEIQGPTEAESDSTEQLFFIAKMSDGSDQQVRATTSTVDKGASITSTGVLTVPVVSEDTTYTVTATYDNEGTVLTDDHTVDVTYVPTASNLVLSGPQSVAEKSTHEYTVTLNFTDGTSVEVTPESLVSDSAVDSVSGVDVTYGGYSDTSNVTLTTTYTYLGEELTATLPITVGADILVLEGATYMDEGNTETYVVKLKHTDGTEDIVNPENFTSSEPGLTISDLDVTASDTSGITKSTLTATYDAGDEVLTATLDVNLGVSTLSLTGPVSINEFGNGTFVLTLTSGEGNSTLVQPTTISSDINSLTFEGLTGNLDNILNDVTATVTATYMNGTEELTATVTVPLKADKLTIRGVTELDGGDSATYDVALVKAGGGEESISPDSFTSSNPDATLEGLTLTVSENAESGTSTLTATYNDGAGDMTATHNVNITAGLFYERATVEGPASFPIEVAQTYQVRLHDNQGGSKLVTMTNPVIVSDSPKATFLDSDTVKVDEDGVESDYTFTIKGDGTWDGVTLTTEDFEVTALYVAPVIESLILRGPTELDLSGTLPVVNDYTVHLKYDDGTEVEVTPNELIWDQPDLATADAATKTLTAENKHYSDDSGILRAKGVEGAPNLESNPININIKASANPIVALNILGPDEIQESGSGNYRLQAVRESGGTYILDASGSEYSITSGSQYARDIETSSGQYIVTPNELDQDRTIVIQGIYVADRDISSTKTVTLINEAEPAVLQSLSIIGLGTVSEDSTTNYTFEATYSDGSTSTITPSSASIATSPSDYSFSTSGDLVVPVVSEESAITLNASYIEDGVTVNATKDVTVRNDQDNAVSLTVEPVTQVPDPYYYGDDTEVQFKATLVRQSGAEEDITNTGTWSMNTYGLDATITQSGVYTAPTDTSTSSAIDLTVVCEGPDGTQGSYVVNMLPKPKSVVSGYISGPDTLNEGDSGSYQLHLVYDDGSEELAEADTWTTTLGDISGGTLTVSDVDGDQVTTITANYSDISVTKDVTIKDLDVVASYAPRFGSIPRITSLAGFDEAFAESLDRPLTGTDGEIMQVQPFDSTYNDNTFVYLMYPKELGFIYAEQLDDSGNVEYTGGIDGAKNWDDNTFDFTGAAEVTINGIEYYVYRNDFSYENLDPEFRLNYGSNDTMSGNR